MLRAMYSAISGLLNHQYRIDVIGNDISNVNTLAYKSKNVDFVTAYTQVAQTASETNPVGIAVGLGSSVQGVTTNFTQGTFATTNVTSNLALSGEGYFIVSSSIVAATGASDGTISFTRAGDFVVDADGYLRTADGNYIMGYASDTVDASLTDVGFTTVTRVASSVTIDETTLTNPNLTAVKISDQIDTDGDGTGDEDVVSYSFGTDGSLVLVGEDGTTTVSGYVGLALFSNQNGLTALAGSYFQSSTASGSPEYAIAGTGVASATDVKSGYLELSNVDLSSEFADMILTQRGFDANAKIITTADEMLQTLISMKR